jgi:hypothetical protein
MKYKLPTAFAVHFEDDPVLKQLKEDGEANNRPPTELFKAACAYLIDSRRYLFIELGRYLEKYGPLEPIDYDTGKPATTNSPESEGIKAEAEVPKEEIYPGGEVTLKVLPKPTEEPRKRFTKSYGEEDQS